MQTEILKVTGMTCGGCTGEVMHVLKALPGVSDAKVSLAAGEATVQYNAQLTSSDQLRSAVAGAGYGVNEPGATVGGPKAKGCCCG